MAANAKVAEIYVQLKADLAEYKKTLGEANVIAKQWGNTMREENQKSREAIRLLNEDLGVHLPRGLQNIISKMPGVSTAMNAAFDAVVVFALIHAVMEVTEKITEYTKKAEETAKKNKTAWQDAIGPIADTNDKLELTKTKLENAIAKLEHKPQNAVKQAIEEATVAADELGRHLDADIKRITEGIKTQQAGWFGQHVLHQTGSNSAVAISQDVEDKFNSISAGTYRGVGDPTKDRDQVIRGALVDAYEKLGNATQLHDSVVANHGGTEPANSSSGVDVRALTELIAGLKGMQTSSQLTQAVSADEGQKGKIEAAETASSDRIKALEQEVERRKALHTISLADEVKFWDGVKLAGLSAADQTNILQKRNAAGEKLYANYWDKGKITDALLYPEIKSEGAERQESGGGAEALASATAKAAEQQATLAADLTLAHDKLALLTGAMTPHAMALKEAAAHTAEYQAKLKALQEQLQGLKNDDAFYVAATGAHDKDTQAKAIGVQSQIDALNNRAHIQNLTDAQATLSTTWTGMVDSVFDELIKKSQSTQDQLKTIALKLVDDLNTQLAKGMTSNGKMDFHAAFASAAQSAAKSSLEKAEGLGLKALGLGSKDKLGTKGNPMIVKMADAAAGEVGKVGKGLMGMLNDSDWASSLFGGKLFGSNSFFGGHALGGPAMAGLPIPVGELGPETFTPSTPGYITPHNQVSSGGPSIGYIDARGTDPVQTQMAVTRGMQLAHSHAVRDAQTAMADRARRRPQ